MSVPKVLVCFGTRPEAIKMAPLVSSLRSSGFCGTEVCVTAQHRQMLDQVLDVFAIRPDYDLDLMAPDQTLERLTSAVLTQVAGVLAASCPDLVVVQGDTTTTFAVALAAYYHRLPVAHLEAGLRTYQRYSPFPEEINRQLTTSLSHWHFAPTARSAAALVREGIPESTVFEVGNTVIDAMLSALPRARAGGLPSEPELAMRLADRRYVLITGHRRENFGDGFLAICRAIRRLAEANPDLEFVYPVHLNPNVQKPVMAILGDLANVRLIRPLGYLEFLWLMDRCQLVLTDSGGVQEEAPTLGKPVLVMRDTTERPEAVEAGVARMVGADEERIFAEVSRLLHDEDAYRRMSAPQNPYGDGRSAERIVAILASLHERNCDWQHPGARNTAV